MKITTNKLFAVIFFQHGDLINTTIGQDIELCYLFTDIVGNLMVSGAAVGANRNDGLAFFDSVF